MFTPNAQIQLNIRKEIAQIIGKIYQSGFSLEESYVISFHTAIFYLMLKKEDDTLKNIHQILQRFSLDEICEQVDLSTTQECGFNANFKEVFA